MDFFCLGGGSLPVLAALAALPSEEYRASVLLSAWIIAAVINNPHFIHSYQIFYDDFRAKIAPGTPLRNRYLFAGIIAPLGLILFFAFAIATLDANLLGKAAYLMLFLVGWHYVKQGYGILIVESVLKKAFLSDFEKKWLRYNALTVWLASWLYFNHKIGSRELYGSEYFLLGLPGWVAQVAIAVGVAMSLFAAFIVLRKATRGPVPVNGIIAYFSACYVWLVLTSIAPLAILLVPAFHSLQYLAVVWRYQLNKEHARSAGQRERFFGVLEMDGAKVHMLRFVTFGIFVGGIAFYILPFALDYSIDYHEEIFGTTMFLFVVSVFINIHHYLLDNVMWRRENPDIKQHLFS